MNACAEDPGSRTVRVLITGRVQGVAYRAWTQQTARRLALRGWVRNKRDGAVEALFSGEREGVEEMLRRCCDGPPAAKVSGVSILEEGGAAPQDFEVLPTI
jgi:acylphosphatase